MSEENLESITQVVKEKNIKDRFMQSTTFAIVIFAMLILVSHVVLMFVFEKEISYMGDLVSSTFLLMLTYVGGEKMVNTWGKK